MDIHEHINQLVATIKKQTEVSGKFANRIVKDMRADIFVRGKANDIAHMCSDNLNLIAALEKLLKDSK